MSSHFEPAHRPRAIAIARADFARLHATPFTADHSLHYRALLTAALPAFGILAVAAGLMLSIL